MSDAARHGSIPPPAGDGERAIGDPAAVAGASARDQHAHRKLRRMQRNEQQFGRVLGRVIGAATAPQHETAWRQGAEGEHRVAHYLHQRCGEAVILLHDRLMPGGRSNIDHLVVAASGVWVIDTKRLQARVTVQRPLLGQPKLMVAGRDKSALLDGVLRQADAVRAALEADCAVDVHAALCFIDADLPLTGMGKARGVHLTGRRGAAAKLRAAGALDSEARRDVAQKLDSAFPSKRH